MSEFDTPKNDFISDDEYSEDINDNNVTSDDTISDATSEEVFYDADEYNENTHDNSMTEYDSAQVDDLYEDEEFEEIEKFEKPKRQSKLKIYVAEKIYEFNKLTKKQRVTYVAVFSAILALIILILTDIIPILPNSYHRSYVGNEYTLGETIGSDVDRCGEYVIYASNGSVMYFGPDMEVEKKISSFQGIPMIHTNKNSGVVYCKNGNSALVMKDKDNYKIVTVDENIYCAKVNSDADYVLLTSEAGYKSCLSAYSSAHKLIYEWHTNSNVIDIALSNNEGYIAASAVEYADTGMSTRLVFIETTSTTPVSEAVIENTVISEVFFTDDNTLIAIGDTASYAYTANGIKKWTISYDGKNLKTYDYDSDGTVAFLFNKYNSELSESTIELYSTSGKKKGRFESDKNVRAVSVNNGYCLLSLDKGTILIDDDADVKKVKEHKEDFQTVVLYENYNFAFGIIDNKASIISVKH